MDELFDPMLDVPKTDIEAEIALRYGKSDLMGRSMVGIFQVYRMQGDALLVAYEKALLASLPHGD